MLALLCRQRQGGYNVDWCEGESCSFAFCCAQHHTAVHSCTYLCLRASCIYIVTYVSGLLVCKLDVYSVVARVHVASA